MNLFDLVYIDVIGHITPTANTGNWWILQCVDSASQARWVYPMKTKGEATAKVTELFINFGRSPEYLEKQLYHPEESNLIP